eukprot:scaffold3467_cov22-Tisochrysis_lutea.AAC.2
MTSSLCLKRKGQQNTVPCPCLSWKSDKFQTNSHQEVTLPQQLGTWQHMRFKECQAAQRNPSRSCSLPMSQCPFPLTPLTPLSAAPILILLGGHALTRVGSSELSSQKEGVARPLLQAPLLGDTVGESEPTPIATPSHPQQQQQQQRSLAAATAAAASYTSDGLGGEAGGGAAASSPNAESSTTFTEGRGEGFARDRDCRYGNSAAPQQQQQQRQCPVVSRAPASMPLNITATPRPPIKEIIHIHRTICASLEDFACEVALLQQLPGVTPQQLALL